MSASMGGGGSPNSDNIQFFQYLVPLQPQQIYTGPGIQLGSYSSLSCILKSSRPFSIVTQFSGNGSDWDFEITHRHTDVSRGEHFYLNILSKWVRFRLIDKSEPTDGPVTGSDFLRFYVYGKIEPPSSQVSLSGADLAKETENVERFEFTPFGELKTGEVQSLNSVLFSSENGVFTPNPNSALPTPTIVRPDAAITQLRWHTFGKIGDQNTPENSHFLTLVDPARPSMLTLFDRFTASHYSSGTIQSGQSVVSRAYVNKTRYTAGIVLSHRFTASFEQNVGFPSAPTGTQAFRTMAGIRTNLNTFFAIGYQRDAFNYNPSDTRSAPFDTAFGIIFFPLGATGVFFLPSAQFNGDTGQLATGGSFDLNPQGVNVFEINVTYLGVASVEFRVLHPGSDKMVTLHTLRFNNNPAQVHTFADEPSFGFFLETFCSANLTLESPSASVISSGSYAALSLGQTISPYAEKFSFNVQGLVYDGPNTPHEIVAIRNNFPGTSISLLEITAAVDGTKPVSISLLKGADVTLPGADVWLPCNTSTSQNYGLMEFYSNNTSGQITYSGSWYTVATITLAKSDQQKLILDPPLQLEPQSAYLFIMESIGASSDAIIGWRWTVQ